MNTNPGTNGYKKLVSIKNTGVENALIGVAGMTVGADGQTLVVSLPNMSNTSGVVYGEKHPGNILILDFKTFNLKTGEIAKPMIASLPSDHISGKSPQVITATKDENRFLVANVADYSRGLSTLTLVRDADGKVTSAKMEAIKLSQPTDNIALTVWIFNAPKVPCWSSKMGWSMPLSVMTTTTLTTRTGKPCTKCPSSSIAHQARHWQWAVVPVPKKSQ